MEIGYAANGKSYFPCHPKRMLRCYLFPTVVAHLYTRHTICFPNSFQGHKIFFLPECVYACMHMTI
ncbi:hypothetical protein BX070DRAFT_221201 [Coemansia spiralis]|nr:hypothetical protein BX070DRAFT_221201 [Coemansia spiralis]